MCYSTAENVRICRFVPWTDSRVRRVRATDRGRFLCVSRGLKNRLRHLEAYLKMQGNSQGKLTELRIHSFKARVQVCTYNQPLSLQMCTSMRFRRFSSRVSSYFQVHHKMPQSTKFFNTRLTPKKPFPIRVTRSIRTKTQLA